MAIARIPRIILDCPDAQVLAPFYADLLGWQIENHDGGWIDVTSEDGQCIAFQTVEEYSAPDWPGQRAPQQMHLDIDVDDLDRGEEAVLALGATKHSHQPGTTFRVFLDPAGHPFCLCAC